MPSSSASTTSGAASDEASADGTSPTAPAATSGPLGATKFVSFGDSITWGTLSSFDGTYLFDAGPTQSYPYQLQSALNGSHPPQVFAIQNRGIPGETASTGSGRLASVLSSDRPQALLLLEGINDLNGGQSVSSTVGRLQTMVDTARLYNVTVFIANMFQTYVTEHDGITRTNAADLIPSFNSSIQQIAQGRQNVFIVDLYHAFGSNRSLVGGDGLHPTEAGYERMADWFRATVEEAYAVRGAFQ